MEPKIAPPMPSGRAPYNNPNKIVAAVKDLPRKSSGSKSHGDIGTFESADRLPPRPSTSAGPRMAAMSKGVATSSFSRPSTASANRRGLTAASYRAPPDLSEQTMSFLLQREVSSDILLRILDEKNTSRVNEIMLLAESGNAAALAKLIESGVDICSYRGMSGYTALHHACNRGHFAVVSALLRNNLSAMNKTNDTGESPLHLATYAGNMLIVEQLLDYGADIDAKNEYGETPLFYAARKSMPALARLLIQRGADINAQDRFGDKPIDHAPDPHTLKAFDTPKKIEEDSITRSSSSRIERGGDEAKDVPGNASSSSSFSPKGLPYTELLLVFQFLEAKDICRAACVAGKWHRVSECEQLWQKLGVRRWERALQSSLGFGPAASTSFARPKRTSSRDQGTTASGGVSSSGGGGGILGLGKQRSGSGSSIVVLGGPSNAGGGSSAPSSRTNSFGSLNSLFRGEMKPGSR